MELTQEGLIAAERARKLLAEAKDLKQTMQGFNNLITGEVRVACPSMVATYYLPNILSPFLQKYSGLTANVFQAGTKKIENLIEEGEIEVGVITTDNPSTALSLVPLLNEMVVLCVNKSHKLSSRKRIKAGDLSGLSMVAYEKDYFIRTKLEEFCSNTGVTPDIRIESNFLPLLLDAVKQNVGATVGLKMLADNEAEIVGVPFSPLIPIDMAVAWHPQKTLSKANQCFVDWLLKMSEKQN